MAADREKLIDGASSRGIFYLPGEAYKTRENVPEFENGRSRGSRESDTLHLRSNVADFAVENSLIGWRCVQKSCSQQNSGGHRPGKKTKKSPNHRTGRRAFGEPGEIIDAERRAAGKIDN